jgi:hypothetical protein
MSRFTVRTPGREDLGAYRQLESDRFGPAEGVLCPNYVRPGRSPRFAVAR